MSASFFFGEQSASKRQLIAPVEQGRIFQQHGIHGQGFGQQAPPQQLFVPGQGAPVSYNPNQFAEEQPFQMVKNAHEKNNKLQGKNPKQPASAVGADGNQYEYNAMLFQHHLGAARYSNLSGENQDDNNNNNDDAAIVEQKQPGQKRSTQYKVRDPSAKGENKNERKPREKKLYSEEEKAEMVERKRAHQREWMRAKRKAQREATGIPVYARVSKYRNPWEQRRAENGIFGALENIEQDANIENKNIENLEKVDELEELEELGNDDYFAMNEQMIQNNKASSSSSSGAKLNGKLNIIEQTSSTLDHSDNLMQSENAMSSLEMSEAAVSKSSRTKSRVASKSASKSSRAVSKTSRTKGSKASSSSRAVKKNASKASSTSSKNAKSQKKK